jgi:hypothetical protein
MKTIVRQLHNNIEIYCNSFLVLFVIAVIGYLGLMVMTYINTSVVTSIETTLNDVEVRVSSLESEYLAKTVSIGKGELQKYGLIEESYQKKFAERDGGSSFSLR